MFYTLYGKCFDKPRFAQTWDGIVVAASNGFEPMLGKPVANLISWASAKFVTLSPKQEETLMLIQSAYPIIIFQSEGKCETRCPLLPEVNGHGKTPQDACDAGWLAVERALQERRTTGRPLPTAEECWAFLRTPA